MSPDSDARSLTFASAVRSDVGLVRENNEDSAYARGDFLALADGMGGHSSGEVASAIAVHTFASQPPRGPEGFSDAAGHTREILRRMSHSDETLETMGTTVVAVQEHHGSFYVCHIGDSRVYTMRHGELTQVTTDHTHVQRLVEMGRITREQVSTHPYRAMLLKSLDDQPGGSAPDLIPIDLQAGDRVLLCSDGLSDYVPEQVIARTLLLPERDEAADALITAALRAGTRDNITVIVADVVSDADPGPPFAHEPQFGGAALEPLTLSPAAAAALAEAAPGFSGPVDVAGQPGDDPLTHTAVLPQVTPGAGGPETSEQGTIRPASNRVPVAGILAGCAVIAVGVAIALLV